MSHRPDNRVALCALATGCALAAAGVAAAALAAPVAAIWCLCGAAWCGIVGALEMKH